jgi:DnaJ-class molecular chaperone
MNYTHYDYLELPPGAPAERIEAAYAQLLGRFHGGEAEGRGDLTGLVRRIHAAYEVLHSEELRRVYDEQLAREAAQADRELKAELDQSSMRATRRVQDVPQPLNAAFSALAA